MKFVVGEVFNFDNRDWTISTIEVDNDTTAAFSAVSFTQDYYETRAFKVEKPQNSAQAFDETTEKITNE